MMKEEGLIGDIVDDGVWKEKAGRFADDADVQALRMSLCRMDAALYRQMRYMDLFQTTGIRFDKHPRRHTATVQTTRTTHSTIYQAIV